MGKAANVVDVDAITGIDICLADAVKKTLFTKTFVGSSVCIQQQL